MSESVARTPRELLDRVIDELNGLRNAGNRSPLFKLWRQNALTAIQRIWPGDVTHSERFRRIPFSAPNTRADGREVRECYERGCGEALSLLKTLREESADRTFASADASARRHSFEPGATEDDFPTLDLADAPVNAPSPEVRRRNMDSDLPLDDEPYDMAGQVDPSISSVRDLTPRPARHTPEPPRAVEPKLKTPSDAAEAPAARPPAKAAANARSKPRSAKKPAPKGRLKDMLGFGDMTDETPSAGSTQPLETAPEEGPLEVPPPVAREERRRPEAAAMREEFNALDSTIKEARANAAKPASRRWTPGATRGERAQTSATPADTGAELPSPAAARAEPAMPAAGPAAPATPDPGPGRSTRRAPVPPAEFLMPPDLDVPAAESPRATNRSAARAAAAEPRRESVPEPEVLQESMVEPAPSDGLHASTPDDPASVTAEFLRNSPVLSSAPRAVRKKAPVVLESFETPTASALQALSAMVAEIGVPEGHRARARAALIDMARLIDTHQMSWDNMREAVQFLMEFPPLARRALPLLLPHLDQAA